MYLLSLACKLNYIILLKNNYVMYMQSSFDMLDIGWDYWL